MTWGAEDLRPTGLGDLKHFQEIRRGAATVRERVIVRSLTVAARTRRYALPESALGEGTIGDGRNAVAGEFSCPAGRVPAEGVAHPIGHPTGDLVVVVVVSVPGRATEQDIVQVDLPLIPAAVGHHLGTDRWRKHPAVRRASE